MKIILNGKEKTFEEDCFTVSELLQKLKLSQKPVVVEFNKKALAFSDYEKQKIEDGSKLEIVELIAGG